MPINQDPHIHKQVICANMFVRCDGKYLLLKRSVKKKFAPGYIHPIGGKVDPRENPYEGAERELFEEAGIKIKNIRLEAVILEILPHKSIPYNWLIFHFSGDYKSGKLKRTQEGKLIWLSADEVKKQNLFPSVRAVINHILNPNDGTVFATFSYDKDGNIIKSNAKIDRCIR